MISKEQINASHFGFGEENISDGSEFGTEPTRKREKEYEPFNSLYQEAFERKENLKEIQNKYRRRE